MPAGGSRPRSRELSRSSAALNVEGVWTRCTACKCFAQAANPASIESLGASFPCALRSTSLGLTVGRSYAGYAPPHGINQACWPQHRARGGRTARHRLSRESPPSGDGGRSAVRAPRRKRPRSKCEPSYWQQGRGLPKNAMKAVPCARAVGHARSPAGCRGLQFQLA